MKYESSKISDVVNYINLELSRNRTMKDIEENDFGVNERVITKRLKRKGYKKINNKFILNNITKSTTEALQIKSVKNTIEDTKKIQIENKNNTAEIQIEDEIKRKFSDDELKKLKELLTLDISILESMLHEYNENKKRKHEITIKHNTTMVTSLRLNEELYMKLKNHCKKKKLKVVDVFNEMMLSYLNNQ